MKGFPKQDIGPKILTPGSLIAERYSVIDVLGQGGMGVVYKARDTNSDRTVAVKMVLRSNMSQDQRRFEREARAASLEGRNLDEIIEKKPLTLNQFRHIFAQTCSGLQHAHEKGIVHRDLKPGNLMIVERDGDKESVIILDFGLVKLMDGENDPDQKVTKLTRTNALLGSPLYMSPEQCRTQNLDHRTDIYSLGCVMYEALTGSPPLVANTLLDVMNKHLSETPRPMKEVLPGLYVPPALERAILHCMAKNPDDRPASMTELAKEIEAAFSGAPDVLLAGQPANKASLDASTRASKQSLDKRKNESKGPLIALGIGAAVCLLPLGIFLGSSLHKDAGAGGTSTRIAGQDRRGAGSGNASVTQGEASATSNATPEAPVPKADDVSTKKNPWAAISPGTSSPIPIGSTGTAVSAVPASAAVTAGSAARTDEVGAPATSLPTSSVAATIPPIGTVPVSSSLPGGMTKSSSPEKALNDANFAFRGGDYSQARTHFEAALALNLSSEKQCGVFGKLVICANKTQDLSASQEYLDKFKDQFAFNSSSAGDSNVLFQVYEIQRRMSDREDFGFSEKILRAAIDDFYRHNSRPDRTSTRMKMELSRVFADQSRDSDAASILQEIISESDHIPDMLNEAKTHLARVQGGPRMIGGPPLGGGPMGDLRRGGLPGMEGGGPFGGPPGGGLPQPPPGRPQ
ncbi:MAG: protein kinase [Candidatus Obscuribacterales bacterium]|nr:protein kinase [Candidatus Obscuribacterales bacterium]